MIVVIVAPAAGACQKKPAPGRAALTQTAIDANRKDFDEVRSHGALDNRTPGEFARHYAATLNSQRLAS
jgi:transposase InsO family protein